MPIILQASTFKNATKEFQFSQKKKKKKKQKKKKGKKKK